MISTLFRTWLSRSVFAASLVVATSSLAVAAEKIIFSLDWLPAGDKAVPYLAIRNGVFAAEG